MFCKQDDDGFFSKSICDRCGNELKGGRTMSWFTTECICMGCADKEQAIKNKLTMMGYNTSDYEGCGHVPRVFDKNGEEK